MTAAFPPPSLAAQIAELKRERQMRARVYPTLIAKGTLKQKNADYQNVAMDAAISTLERLDAAIKSGGGIVDGDEPDAIHAAPPAPPAKEKGETDV